MSSVNFTQSQLQYYVPITMDTETVWFILGLVATIPLSVVRSLIVFDYLDQVYFNVISTAVLHVCFVGVSSYLHVVAMVAYTVYLKGQVSLPSFLLVLYGHLTYVNAYYGNITTSIHMMIALRAHYYFMDTTPSRYESPKEEAVSYLLNPVGYFTGPTISYSAYTDLAINDETTLHVDSKALVNTLRYAVTCLVGNEVVSYANHSYFGIALSLPVEFFVLKNRYYAIWELSKFIAQLYGYPEHLAINIRPEQIEKATVLKDVVQNWNISAQAYLRNAVYKPLIASSIMTPLQAKMATFIVSGLWHGLSWRYMVGFVGMGLFSTFGSTPLKYRYHKNKTIMGIYQALSNLVSYVYLQVMLGFIVLPMYSSQGLWSHMSATWPVAAVLMVLYQVMT